VRQGKGDAEQARTIIVSDVNDRTVRSLPWMPPCQSAVKCYVYGMVTKLRLPRSAPALRRDQILEIASSVFMADGYGATSMSGIAARLGGSKATLYKYFPSKEQLFQAVMETKCAVLLDTLREIELSRGTLREFLYAYGCRFLQEILKPAALDLHRLVVAESARFPEVAQIFFTIGPDYSYPLFASRLADFARQGKIRCPDPLLTAQQFLGMIRGEVHTRVLCGIMSPLSKDEIERQVRHAVDLIVGGLQLSADDEQS